jgi:DNA polymerase-3 subunit epsilon
MTYLFFDTETTGLPNRRLALSDSSQPHICQLGAIVTDSIGSIKSEINLIIKPEGWIIPPEASKIHGITQEDAEKYGVSIKGALNLFSRLVSFSSVIVAHNISFDLELIAIQAERAELNIMFPDESFCTMKESHSHVKAPLTQKQIDAGFSGYKSPNLQETYKYFFGKEFEGAHDAMADVRACKDIFFELKRINSNDK